MLSNFFRINLPYGIAKNKNGEWMAFNREYLPLGYNDLDKKGNPGMSYLELPVYTKYKRVTNAMLFKLAWSESGIRRNENGEIETIFLYNDATNPVNQYSDKSHLWEQYFEKLRLLSKLKAS